MEQPAQPNIAEPPPQDTSPDNEICLPQDDIVPGNYTADPRSFNSFNRQGTMENSMLLGLVGLLYVVFVLYLKKKSFSGQSATQNVNDVPQIADR